MTHEIMHLDARSSLPVSVRLEFNRGGRKVVFTVVPLSRFGVVRLIGSVAISGRILQNVAAEQARTTLL